MVANLGGFEESGQNYEAEKEEKYCFEEEKQQPRGWKLTTEGREGLNELLVSRGWCGGFGREDV